MANDITGNPWKLDTAGLITNSQVHIKNLVWAGGTTAGTVLLLNGAGKDVLRAVYNEGGNNNFGVFQWVNGLNLVQISGGELLIVIHK